MALTLGQKAIFFLQWWGRGRGPVGKIPHHSMVLKNALTEATDGNGALVRLVLVDFKKAISTINQLFVMKLDSLDIPLSIINWVRDFLTDIKE
jgi:hypothetical protein